MTAGPRGGNRALIALAGLLLLGAGGAVLVAGLGAAPDAVLLSEATRERWQDRAWWWPAVMAALAVLVVLALMWLAAQLRRPRAPEVLVDTHDGGAATLRGRALEAALEAEAEAVDGVARARVRLTGAGAAPEAYVSLYVEPDADPAFMLTALTDTVLHHARATTGLPVLPVEVHVRAAGRRVGRVT
ncbi:alkaline shock response membrane anchor protein AmaP [Streptomyces sp. MUM 203J]|uniref:alkaline shock response membrane anchor protein AmaP n=1 Tax=Streptomyces sp. MUM 203J TaxID=2791990 RepID=UPI001F0378D6|nr:alkaline shock response membrane anchor protein AmaP [Streptomyces sp. MUM 203J]MCH0539558.1 alkaline shock response membrane anchor protein AmaP [Streptomyces sp. MUM 203J]